MPLQAVISVFSWARFSLSDFLYVYRGVPIISTALIYGTSSKVKSKSMIEYKRMDLYLVPTRTCKIV